MMKLKSAQKEIRLPIFSPSVIYLTASLLCAMSSSMAWAQQPDAKAQVIINGQTLSEEQVRLLERTVGIVVQPGHYIINVQNGCWANLTNKTRGCLGQTGFSEAEIREKYAISI